MRGSLAVLLLLALVMEPRADARSSRGQAPAKPTSAEEAAKQEAAGLAALAAGNPAEALRLLEQSYLTEPRPALLYQLGRLAQAEGRAVAASDLYRRYLKELGTEPQPPEPLQQELRKQIASTAETSSEIDVLSGDGGAVLTVDDRVAGELPLSEPLLVAAGRHRFKIEKDGRHFQTNQLQIPPRQRAQLDLALSSSYAVLVLTPGVVLLLDPATISPPLVATLSKEITPAVATVARQERSFLISSEKTSAALSQLGVTAVSSCAKDLTCQERLARQLDAAAVLVISLSVTGNGITGIGVRLLDVASGMLIGKSRQDCDACDPTRTKELVGTLAGRLLKESTNRGRSTLVVTSVPAEAQVVVDGRELGVTPLSREALDGSHELVLSKTGFEPHRSTLVITEDQPAKVAITLQRPVVIAEPPAEPPPAALIVAPPKPPPTRPRWRFIVGGLGLGAALVGSYFGTTALAVNQLCTGNSIDPAPCANRYNTAAPGGVLLGVSAAVAVGSVLLIGWPAK